MQDSKRDTDVKNRLLDSVGEGKGGMIWENSIETCEIDHQSKFDAWNRALKAVALGSPWKMGWEGRWEGFQDGGRMYIHDWFMSMNGKNHYSIVK